MPRLLSDATWWLINFWLPDFYRKEFGLTTSELAVPLAIAFLGSGAARCSQAWLSTRLLERGMECQPRAQERDARLGADRPATLPFVLALDSFWPVAIMMGVRDGGHQGFSLSIFSTITDVVPRAKVGRVTAFGAFMGNIGGAADSAGDRRGAGGGLGFTPLFIFALYPICWRLAGSTCCCPNIRRAE